MIRLLLSLLVISAGLVVSDKSNFAIIPITLTLLGLALFAFKAKAQENEQDFFSNKDKQLDFLTSLDNRQHYLKTINKLIENQSEFSLFNIDLNNFKCINDLHGHDIGDIVLEEVGLRFKTLTDHTTSFARFGGDEFAVLYKCTDSQKINELGSKIHRLLDDPIKVSESEFHVSASIGVSRFPLDAENASDLLKLADMAMYYSKKNEVYDHYLISNELNQKLLDRKKIERLLKDIDIEKDLFLRYQPIFDIKTKELLGMEALIRWNHATEGIIEPLDFIPVAEEIDMVKNITKWCFITGITQIKSWNEHYGTNLKLSVNVSDSCIHNRIFFENLKLMIETFDIKPSWIAIGLTEVSLTSSPNYMKKLLNRINALGVDIHVDDFGTSYLRLADLKHFKIKTIKIDNSYVNEIENDESSSIVRAMILLAQGLDITSLAEGVETQQQLDTLTDYGCEQFQGDLKDKPLLANEFEDKYLKSQ